MTKYILHPDGPPVNQFDVAELSKYAQTYDEYYRIAQSYKERRGWLTIPLALWSNKGELGVKPATTWGNITQDTPLEKIWATHKTVKKKDDDGRERKKKKRQKSVLGEATTIGLALVCGKVSGVVVLDVDDFELFEKETGIKIEELMETTDLIAVSKSGGLHFFYKYENIPTLLLSHSKGFDLKSDKGLITLPPSVGPVKDKENVWGQYAWLKEGEPKSLPDWLKRKLKLSELSKEHTQALERERAHKPLQVVGKWKNDELSKIAQRLRSLWLQGVITGYDVDTEGIGALIDLGLTDKQIHKVIEGVFEQEYDDGRTQYMIDRTRDIKENDGQYRGVGSLIYRLKQIENEDAKALLQLIYRHALYEPYKHVIGEFYTDLEEKTLYKETKEGDYVRVGPYIKPLAILHTDKEGTEEDKVYLLYEYAGERKMSIYGEKKRMVEEIQKKTRRLVLKESDFANFLGFYDENLPNFPLQDHVGWDDKKWVFYLPQITFEGLYFDQSLADFGAAGSKEKELELMKRVFKYGEHLALGYIFGFAAPLVYPLGTGNFVVFFEGKTGKGKTATNNLALSLYGYYENLQLTMHATDTASELILNQRRDVYTCFDETNTSKAKDIADQLVRMIYTVRAAQGKKRGTKNLVVRKPSKFRGIVGITSEESLSAFMEAAGRSVGGAHRRVIIVSFADFNLEETDSGLFTEINENTKENYGNLIVDWINYIQNNMDEIKKSYRLWLATLQDKDRGYKFNQQEYYLALLFATAEHMCKVFNIDTQDKEKIFGYLWKICETNDASFKETLKYETPEGMRELIYGYITRHNDHLDVEDYKIERDLQGNEKLVTDLVNRAKAPIFGKYEAHSGYLYLTGDGYNALASYIRIPTKELAKLLIKFGFAEKSSEGATQLIKRTKIKLSSGISPNVYIIKLMDDDSKKEEKPTQQQLDWDKGSKKGGGKGGGQDSSQDNVWAGSNSNGASSNGAGGNEDVELPDYLVESF